MWKGHSVSVVLPTYHEKDSIRAFINDLLATKLVDEVLVVNNNAEPGTVEEVRKTPARMVFEKRQGLGWAIRKGLLDARGDLVVVSEPDGTFVARDVEKLLVFSDDCDVVFGTRTTRELIWEGANMGFLLKWGNWVWAKTIEVLYATSHISDVGCTMRLLKKRAIRRIAPRFEGGNNAFNAQMMVLVILKKLKWVEIPLNYKSRPHGRGMTESKWKAFKIGIQMMYYILKARLLSWMRVFP